MQKKLPKCFIFVLFIAFNSILSAAERRGQDLILPGHWVYESFRRIELEQKKLSFVDVAPLTIYEFKSNFNKIDYDKLSEPGKREYERIQEYLNEKNWAFDIDIFSIGVEPSVNPEFYATTDCLNSGDNSIPWIYDYTNRLALVDLPIKVNVGDYVSLYMGLQAKQSRIVMERPGTFFNDVFGVERIDAVITHDNYLSTGYNWENGVGINLKFGIFPQTFGQTIMPSAVISEYLTDTPVFDFRIYSPIFGYDLNVTQFTRSSYLYTHRIEAKLWDIIQISFIEGVFANDTFDLRFINPFAIFHGLGLFKIYEDALRINSLFAFKLNVTPVKNLRIYALLVENEHQMAVELAQSVAASRIPEGCGVQTGVEYSVPLKKGYLHFGTEFYYATPYLFIKDTPMLSFARVYTENLVDHNNHYYQWMGNPLGPDSIGAVFIASYDVPGKWNVNLKYNFYAKGENSDALKNSGWNYYENTNGNAPWIYDENTNMRSLVSPSGIPEYYNIITISGGWSPLEWLSFSLQPSYVFVTNFQHKTGDNRQAFQFAFSTKLNLNKLVKLNKVLKY